MADRKPPKSGSKHPFENLRILVVEDDASLRKLLKLAFGREGIEVITYDDGREGLLAFSEQDTFDVVMADNNLPGLNGIEILNYIRALDSQIPLVLMSGMRCEIAESELSRMRITELHKPFRVSEAVALVRELIAQSHEVSLEGSD